MVNYIRQPPDLTPYRFGTHLFGMGDLPGFGFPIRVIRAQANNRALFGSDQQNLDFTTGFVAQKLNLIGGGHQSC